MTFKWTYLAVAVVVLAAIAALATTGGGWGSYSLAQGVGLILVGGFVVFMAQRASKRRLRPSEIEETPSAVAAPFVGYPKDQALAIFDSENDAREATRDLEAEGYNPVNRFAGVRGAAEIDSQGEVHGGIAKAERTIEHMASDVSDLEDYDAAVRRGRIVLGVHVDGERRNRVADIMKRHRGHDVRYFGELAAESLSADPSRTRAD